MIFEVVKIKKLIYGGQGLAEMIDGRKVFVWNALPEEVVKIQVYKEKSSYCEAIVVEIIKPSKLRQTPKDNNFLSTSPWQILSLADESNFKLQFVNELIEHHKLEVNPVTIIKSDNKDWYYRNKMEYSFCSDEGGLYLSYFRRDSHTKDKIIRSSLSMLSINQTAGYVVDQLNKLKVKADILKSLIIRSDQLGNTLMSLFVTDNLKTKFVLEDPLVGIEIFYSDPRSLASIPTKLIYRQGEEALRDVLINNQSFLYNSRSFFQINVPVYRLVLERMKKYLSFNEITDLYSGVGSIGMSLAKKTIVLVDNDQVNLEYAKLNALNLKLQAETFYQRAENISDKILSKVVVIDPPRLGINKRLIKLLRQQPPEMIGYLSCNPITQIRDLKLLSDLYKIEDLSLYNFFPHTAHIESLAILKRR